MQDFRSKRVFLRGTGTAAELGVPLPGSPPPAPRGLEVAPVEARASLSSESHRIHPGHPGYHSTMALFRS